MKKPALITLAIFFAHFSFSQNPLVKVWDYRYGGTDAEYLYCARQTSDGGYILGGYSYSGIGGDKTQGNWGDGDYWIVKIDSNGTKQWDKDFGGTGMDYLYSIQQTTDGGYILGGASASGISGDKTQATWGGTPDVDYWIVKTDSLGIKQWDRDYGGMTGDMLTSLQQTTDGGYLLGGYSFSGVGGDKTQANWGDYDYWILKTDSLGNKLWDKDFGGTADDFLYDVQQTTDHGYMLAGWSISNAGGTKSQNVWGSSFDSDYWIVKTDSLGTLQWEKDFGGIDPERLFLVRQTSDKGYILGGWSNSNISGDKTQSNWDASGNTTDNWILKIDSLGNRIWDKDFGGTIDEELVGNIFLTNDNGFLFGGTSYSDSSGDKSENNLGQEQSWFYKTDSLGNKQWDKTLRTNSIYDDETGFGFQTREGCYVMINWTAGGMGGDKSQPSRGNSDYWAVKFCETLQANFTAPHFICPGTWVLFLISPPMPFPTNGLSREAYPVQVQQQVPQTFAMLHPETMMYNL